MKDLHIPVLDQYLQVKALQQNKVVAGVETDAENCEAMNSLPDAAAVSMLNATLYDLKGKRNGSESLILGGKEQMAKNYICGRWEPTVYPTTTPVEVQIGEDTKSSQFSFPVILKPFLQPPGGPKSCSWERTR